MKTHAMLSLIFLAIALGVSYAEESSATGKLPVDAKQFDALHGLIKPGAGEARWTQVPWMPSTDIWAARQKAAREDKPLLLWFMAGEPLGNC